MNEKARLRILLFEDDAGVTLLTREALERNHYQVDVAPNGATGLKLFSKNRYDVVLLDLLLPDMTGLEIFQELKRVSPHVLGIMVTGSGDEKSAVEALKSGVSDYIIKATNATHLATLPVVIERVLEHENLKQEKERLQDQLKEYVATLEQKVARRTQELEKAYEELKEKSDSQQKFFDMMVGRELRMGELKTEVNDLLQKLGKPPKYGVLEKSKPSSKE